MFLPEFRVNDNSIRLSLNNQRLVVENYFGSVTAQVREKILSRSLNEEVWKDLLFRNALSEEQVKKSSTSTALVKNDRSVDLDIVDKIVADTGLPKRYVQKLLMEGLTPAVIYDCHFLADKHGKRANVVVSIYKKDVSTDILAILLQAEEDTELSIGTLHALLVFCHGSDDLKEVIEEEVENVFSDALALVTDFSDKCVMVCLGKAKELKLFDLDKLMDLIQNETDKKRNEWWNRYATRPAKPYTEPLLKKRSHQ